MSADLRIRAAVLAAIAAVAVVLAVLLSGSGDYRVHAHFQNASGLVEGGLVQVAGRKVGSIEAVEVTDDGQADVTLSIDDDAVEPLRAGTRATIRALGQAGITNHFVDLAPGSSSTPEIRDGGTLPTEQTTSMVNLDAVLDSFGPTERKNLQRLVEGSDEVFAGSGAARFNSMLGELDPALEQVGRAADELAGDREAIRRVIRSGRAAAQAVGSRRTDLQEAVASAAAALRTVAGERAALAGILDRAPSVLAQASGTLRSAGTTLTALRPALRDVPPAARPLGGFLARTSAVLPAATPVAKDLNAQLPALTRGLDGLRTLRPSAVKAIDSAGRALDIARPILRGARFYGSDFVIGILGGLVGAGSYNYSQWGHYERLDFVQPPQTSLSAIPGSDLFQKFSPLPGVIDIKTRQLRRCPGANVPPAIDGSTPWVADPNLCDPAHAIPGSVNEP